MAGFETGIFGVKSDRSANGAKTKTTALVSYLNFLILEYLIK